MKPIFSYLGNELPIGKGVGYMVALMNYNDTAIEWSIGGVQNTVSFVLRDILEAKDETRDTR